MRSSKCTFITRIIKSETRPRSPKIKSRNSNSYDNRSRDQRREKAIFWNVGMRLRLRNNARVQFSRIFLFQFGLRFLRFFLVRRSVTFFLPPDSFIV